MSHASLVRRGSLVAAGLLALACGQRGTDLVVQGSPTFLPVALPAVAAYRAPHPASAILLSAGGAEGVRSLAAGSCDLAALARPLTPEETRRLGDAGVELRTFLLGHAAAVPIVHKDNPVAELSAAQLRAIWSGQVRRWSEVGGPDLPIHVVTRAPGSALADLWDEAVLGGAAVRPDAQLAAAPAAGGTDPLVALVARDPAAIGFAASGAAGVKALAVGGVAASEANVRQGRFPLARALYLLLDGRTATDTVQGFVDYLLEPDGQRLVRKAGFLPA